MASGKIFADVSQFLHWNEGKKYVMSKILHKKQHENQDLVWMREYLKI